MAKARRSAGKPRRKKLGNWKVRRRGETQVVLTLPKGMRVTGRKVSMRDVLNAIAIHRKVKKGGVVIKCCSGNMAIA